MRICRENAVDGIVHLASPLTMDVVANPATGIRDVCLGTNTVFATAREAGIGKVVWTSSVAVYGAAARYGKGALPEDALHDPPTLYGAAKSLCEVMARQMATTTDVDIVGLRLSVVYGAGRRASRIHDLPVRADARRSLRVLPSPCASAIRSCTGSTCRKLPICVSPPWMSSRRSGGRVYNAFGDCRSWRDAAEILKAMRPELAVELRHERDEALAGTVEDYETIGLHRGLRRDPALSAGGRNQGNPGHVCQDRCLIRISGDRPAPRHIIHLHRRAAYSAAISCADRVAGMCSTAYSRPSVSLR